jgi:hypothetical protein
VSSPFVGRPHVQGGKPKRGEPRATHARANASVTPAGTTSTAVPRSTRRYGAGSQPGKALGHAKRTAGAPNGKALGHAKHTAGAPNGKALGHAKHAAGAPNGKTLGHAKHAADTANAHPGHGPPAWAASRTSTTGGSASRAARGHAISGAPGASPPAQPGSAAHKVK